MVFVRNAVVAVAAAELALAVLAPPGPPQQTILGHLEQDAKSVAVKGTLGWLLTGLLAAHTHTYTTL
jgi:hypothetical protein